MHILQVSSMPGRPPTPTSKPGKPPLRRIAQGHIDRLYVRASCLGQGVGSALLHVLERDAPRPLDVEASITAKPFFERHGYRAVARQTVTRRGIELTNYRMVKRG